MNTSTLTRHFDRIGARLVVRRDALPQFRLDIIRDRRGEAFELRGAVDLHVLQAVPADRHLLLYAPESQDRFLCGHDERHWFAATIGARVSTVREAKASLMPLPLRPRRLGQLAREDERRHNGRFVRQGEWFFVPSARELEGIIHRDEPITRGRSKPHLCEELMRTGGRAVRLLGRAELSEADYTAMLALDPRRVARVHNVVADAEVYVRGRIRHPDHATLILPFWHRVFMNTEARSANMVFYD